MNSSVLTIESTRDRHDLGPACLLRWDELERYASVTDVRQTAEDLFTCAAYADLIAELLRVGLDTESLSGLTTAMLRHRQPRYFGTPATVFVLPAGSSTLRQGRVLLGRRNQFHQGDVDGVLSVDEARTMARAWLEAAEAAEADSLFGAVLERSGRMVAPELEALFTLVRDIRDGRADLPPGNRER